MAKRKLTSFDIEEDLKLALKKANLKTVEDVLGESFLQLMIALNTSAAETENLINKVSLACLPPCYKGNDLIEKENENCVPFGDLKLDLVLRGGLQRGSLTEFTGPSGVGKTQMCFHLALQCLQKWSHNGVCCIDTEGSFRPERLYEIIDQSGAVERVPNMLSKFHVFQPKTISALNEILSQLELFCIDNDVGLVIVDSIASLARKEFSQDTKFHRATTLSSWAAQFKALADRLNLSVIVTNQVTSRITKNDSSDEDDDYTKNDTISKETLSVVPALGNTWTHFVNTRLILQYLNSEERQLIVAKSPMAPIAAKSFRITKKGINFIGDICCTSDGMNSSQYGIKVQPPF